MSKAILTKLLAIQKAVVGLTKDAKGNAGDYVSGNKILGIVRPLMDKLGLILIPEVLDSNFERQDYNTSKGSKSEMFCSLKIKFTWFDVDTGESLETLWASSGMNGFDKGYGSALTYGERYYLLKLFHIATDRDDVDAPKSAEEEMNDMNWEAYFKSLGTVEELDAAWGQYGQQLHGNKAVLTAFNKRKLELMKSK